MFLTTHSLSKIVKITGDIIPKDKKEVQGFRLIMYREGEDEELLNGLKKTENSFTLIDSLGWTSFEYKAYTLRNKEAGRLGIQNFKENISKVLLFCPEIRSIELNDDDLVIIGSPIWGDHLSTPINELLTQFSFNKETTKFVLYPAGETTKKSFAQIKKLGFIQEAIVISNPLKKMDAAKELLKKLS